MDKIDIATLQQAHSPEAEHEVAANRNPTAESDDRKQGLSKS